MKVNKRTSNPVPGITIIETDGPYLEWHGWLMVTIFIFIVASISCGIIVGIVKLIEYIF